MDEIVSNGKVFRRCCWCEQLVQLNKPILGGLHICLTEEERHEKTRRAQQPHTKNY